jgi:hypothetical protein
VRFLRHGHHVSHKEEVGKDQSPDEAGRDGSESFLAAHANLVSGTITVDGTIDAFNRCLSDATKPEYVLD